MKIALINTLIISIKDNVVIGQITAAADKAKLTQVTAVLMFSTKVQQISTVRSFISGTFLNLINSITAGVR